MRSGVVIFPGSNCDRDVITVAAQAGLAPEPLWHGDASIPAGCDLIILPGGFSYGDYLRCGAMAAHSPIVKEVVAFARSGGLVLGICNGFQVLCETGLLPGTMMKNDHLRFNCKEVWLRVDTNASAFASEYEQAGIINIPIAHHDGSYYADDDTVKALEDEDRIAFRYVHADGTLDKAANPNGSVGNIAGVYNESRNVLGLMPHPERHADPLTGGIDGLKLFHSIVNYIH